MWVYHAPILKSVYFDYRKGRSQQGPLEMLNEFEGYLQTDGYGVYHQFGLKVNIVANTSGVVTEVKVNSPGNNYKAGDIITINRADVIGNAKFLVQNVSKSNGEIKITEYDGATVSGTFKFNAPLVDGGSTDPEVLNYQYGVFYKVPVIPAP